MYVIQTWVRYTRPASLPSRHPPWAEAHEGEGAMPTPLSEALATLRRRHGEAVIRSAAPWVGSRLADRAPGPGSPAHPGRAAGGSGQHPGRRFGSERTAHPAPGPGRRRQPGADRRLPRPGGQPRSRVSRDVISRLHANPLTISNHKVSRFAAHGNIHKGISQFCRIRHRHLQKPFEHGLRRFTRG